MARVKRDTKTGEDALNWKLLANCLKIEVCPLVMFDKKVIGGGGDKEEEDTILKFSKVRCLFESSDSSRPE